MLFAVIGTLAGLGYRHIISSINKLQRQDSKLFAAIITLLVAKADDANAIANALHGLLVNGIEQG